MSSVTLHSIFSNVVDQILTDGIEVVSIPGILQTRVRKLAKLHQICLTTVGDWNELHIHLNIAIA